MKCPYCDGELELKAKQEPKKPFRYPKEFNDWWKEQRVYYDYWGTSKRAVYDAWKKEHEVVVFPGDQD